MAVILIIMGSITSVLLILIIIGIMHLKRVKSTNEIYKSQNDMLNKDHIRDLYTTYKRLTNISGLIEERIKTLSYKSYERDFALLSDIKRQADLEARKLKTKHNPSFKSLEDTNDIQW